MQSRVRSASWCSWFSGLCAVTRWPGHFLFTLSPRYSGNVTIGDVRPCIMWDTGSGNGREQTRHHDEILMTHGHTYREPDMEICDGDVTALGKYFIALQNILNSLNLTLNKYLFLQVLREFCEWLAPRHQLGFFSPLCWNSAIDGSWTAVSTKHSTHSQPKYIYILN